MLALISPAKSLDFAETPFDLPTTKPAFQKEANALVDVARDLSASDLSKLMSISDDLAQLNHKRFKAFKTRSTDNNARPAALTFAGDTYTGLRAGDLSDSELDYAQDHLRILSGLYGLLRPLDIIQPYRLEMGSRLKTEAASNLYGFWDDKITKAVRKAAKVADTNLVLNAASQEYFKAVKPDALKLRVITPAFEEESEDSRKMIGFFAKKARGAIARFMITERIRDTEDLKAFNWEGYSFRKDLSEGDRWVFTRPAVAKAA